MASKKINFYYEELCGLLKEIKVFNKRSQVVPLVDGVESVVKVILERHKNGKKMILIGNGASATIASHQATDFWKNAKVRAIAFNDASLLTCVSNDFGYEHVFEKPIEMFADSGDILVAISSSGKSANILKAVKAAVKKGCYVITLSGFSKNNPLLKIGDINFYVPVNTYSHVEIIHHSICHYILEIIKDRIRSSHD